MMYTTRILVFSHDDQTITVYPRSSSQTVSDPSVWHGKAGGFGDTERADVLVRVQVSMG